ncbi:hypothetical protein [Roseitranquillus sediminis]|uniref:hypothetical protein n=1 Tax=Roseitranquillus sediminis TaxID=2809051 RepID=UPI001D0C426E|nr:hypothetical protein [Roseitranquillus sediminis]MBM9594561.1 hypothetical protein [Roseitranquillus sediminis]
MPDVKIATCCYCGTRAALTLKGRERHELACASCGAPLHAMKRLKARQAPVARREIPHQPLPRRPKRRKKSIKHRLFAKALDTIEDIFD